ncbi:hypothetical protein D1872_233390 [compost metagenome]
MNRFVHFLLNIVGNLANHGNRLPGLVRQLTNFIGDDHETAPCGPRASGFNRGVQGQNVGLLRNVLHDIQHFQHGRRTCFQRIHLGRQRIYHLYGHIRLIQQAVQIACPLLTRSFHLMGGLFHFLVGGNNQFHLARDVLGQRVAAFRLIGQARRPVGDFLRCHGDLFGRNRRFVGGLREFGRRIQHILGRLVRLFHEAGNLLHHDVKAGRQLADFIFRIQLHPNVQIASCAFFHQVLQLGERISDHANHPHREQNRDNRNYSCRYVSHKQNPARILGQFSGTHRTYQFPSRGSLGIKDGQNVLSACIFRNDAAGFLVSRFC